MAQTFKRRSCHVDDRIWGRLFAPVCTVSRHMLLHLGLPLLYALLVPTLFSGWYYSHYALANGIWYALIVLGLISWAVSLARKIAGR